MNPLVNICIPTYDKDGNTIQHLNQSFNILEKQSYKNFNLIITDNSKNDNVKKLCKSWHSKLNIKYYLNDIKYGMSQNINYCLSKADGEVIKILFQDDYLLNENSLELLVSHFVGNYNHWLITACCHTNDGVNLFKPLYPFYHDNIHYGENTISCPSVLMFKNENILEFDENLCWLMDVEYYKRLYEKFGLPSICNYITVVNREHVNQTSNILSIENKNKDLKYIKNKYEQL